MSDDEPRDKRVSLRLPASLYARLQAAARADRRPASMCALLAIERWLDDFEREQAARRKP